VQHRLEEDAVVLGLEGSCRLRRVLVRGPNRVNVDRDADGHTPRQRGADRLDGEAAGRARVDGAGARGSPRLRIGLFDRFVIVDWSASNRPRTGKDSVWIADLDATGSLRTQNPATRGRAEVALRSLLRRAVESGERVLVGFDFPFGYPRGFAAALNLDPPAWWATWRLLSAEIRDLPETNANNRFEVAARLNARLGAHAFWGRPGARALADLSARRDRVVYRPGNGTSGVAERREVETAVGARGQHPQPVWKLLGTGSVGSQALTGIPVVARLREDPLLAGVSAVWPFEVAVPELPPGRAAVILTEIWPSMIPIPDVDGRVKDELQVLAVASSYLEQDRTGTLVEAFAAAPARAGDEEGWILGVGTSRSVCSHQAPAHTLPDVADGRR